MKYGHIEIRNLTPHDVDYINPESGWMATIHPWPRQDEPARVDVNAPIRESFLDLNFKTQQLLGVKNLPDPEPNVLYIVSALVMNQLRSEGSLRTDIISPGTGTRDNVIRDSNNRVRAITVFQALHPVNLDEELVA